MAAVMTSKYTPKRYGSFDSLASQNLSRYGSLESLASSQGGTNGLQNYATPQQNYASATQSPSSSTMSTASYPSSYFPSPPPFLGHQSPLPPQPTLPFMFQQQRQPFIYHPGMSPNPIFGQVPYFNQGLQSPMGVPPAPASPAPFVFTAQPVTPSPNLMTPPPNFTNQASQFMNHPASVSQASNFVNQNSAMVQAVAAGAQWQQAPPSPYGMSPLNISIPSTPPPNVIQTPVPSPYNVPPSRYFGNMQ